MNNSLYEKFLICAEHVRSANLNSPKWINKRELLLKVFHEQNRELFKKYISMALFSSENYTQAIDDLTRVPGSPSLVDELFKYTLRFTKEKILRTGTTSDIDTEIILYYERNISKLDKAEQEDKLFIDICFNEFYINGSRNASSDGDIFKRHKEELREIQDKIETYKDSLANLHSEYSFVSLSHAFSNLLTLKAKEQRNLTIYSISLALLALLLPLALVYINLLKASSFPLAKINFNEILTPYFTAALPAIAAEVLIIYYFRIILQQYYSVKGQILQLNHRQAACAFIEGYSNFKKDKPDNSLKMFEELLFSPLSFSPDKIPSTFDGIDQISNLVKRCTK